MALCVWVVLGMEPRPLHGPGKRSTTELHSSHDYMFDQLSTARWATHIATSCLFSASPIVLDYKRPESMVPMLLLRAVTEKGDQFEEKPPHRPAGWWFPFMLT